MAVLQSLVVEQALQSVSERPLHYYLPVPRPDRHRAELVAATGQLLRRQGYSGTSVSDFLDAAGAVDATGISEPLRLAAAGAFARWSGVFERALARTRDADTAAAQARVLLSAIEGALLLDRTSHGTTHLEALRDAVPVLLA